MPRPGASFAAHCVELLAPLGAARSRPMFGGHGLYLDELFVGIVAGEQLYLKTDAGTTARFVAAGGPPFVYEARGRRMSLGFHAPPAEALESPALFEPWARLAVEAALRSRKPAPVRRPAARPRSPATRARR